MALQSPWSNQQPGVPLVEVPCAYVGPRDWFNAVARNQPLAAQTRVKPSAEVLVEGELSPFEHERIFQILKKRFTVSQPSYVEPSDENLATRITIIFRHQYDS